MKIVKETVLHLSLHVIKQGDMGLPGSSGIPGLNGFTGRKVKIQIFLLCHLHR